MTDVLGIHFISGHSVLLCRYGQCTYGLRLQVKVEEHFANACAAHHEAAFLFYFFYYFSLRCRFNLSALSE